MDRLEASLRALIDEFGLDAVKQKLGSVGKQRRRRGRPPGPAIDDCALIQEAAKVYRDGELSLWSALARVSSSPADTRRLYRRLLGDTLWDKFWLYKQRIADLHEAAAGRNKIGDGAQFEAFCAELPGMIAQMEIEVRRVCLSAMLNCSDKADARQMTIDYRTLLTLVTDCEAYEAEAQRLLDELGATRGAAR